MLNKSTDAPVAAANLLEAGKVQTEAMLDVQNELLATYERSSRTWRDRVGAEMELWSEFMGKLGHVRSMPDALQIYQETVSQRMQMAMDDGLRMIGSSQEMMRAFTKQLSRGWLPGATTAALNEALDKTGPARRANGRK